MASSSRSGHICPATTSGVGSRPRSRARILACCQKLSTRSPPRRLARLPRSLRPHAIDLDQRGPPTRADRTMSPIRRYSYETLRQIGWPLFRVARYVEWCGHGQELFPVPDEEERGAVGAGDRDGPVI